MKLDQALKLYLNHLSVERNLAKNSLESYARDLRSYVEHFEQKSNSKSIQEKDIQEFLNEKRSDHSEASITRLIASIRGFHKFLLQEELLDHNPAQYLIVGSKALRLPKTISSDQMNKLIDSISGQDPNSTRDKLIFEFLDQRIRHLVDQNQLTKLFFHNQLKQNLN